MQVFEKNFEIEVKTGFKSLKNCSVNGMMMKITRLITL